MTDEELRDKLANKFEIECPATVTLEDVYKSGWNAARANQVSQYHDMTDTLVKAQQECDKLQAQVTLAKEALSHFCEVYQNQESLNESAIICAKALAALEKEQGHE